MKAPLLPAAEAERLEALRQADILDTPPEPAFDDLAYLAKTICKAPIAFVSLVDARRVWFKARIDFDAPEIPRQISFCGHAILADDVFVIPDTLADERFADNPLVTFPPHVRFYAGVPILAQGRYALGTLCVIDFVPRDLTLDQVASLRGLGRQVGIQIEFRRAAAAIAASAKEAWAARVQLEAERVLLRGVLRAATEYSIIGTDPEGVITVFNEGAERMLGYHAADVFGRVVSELIHNPAEIAERAAALGIDPGFDVLVAAARRGEPETREWTYLRKDGGCLPVSLTVTAMRGESGALTGFIGIARDVTGERLAEKERARFLVERAAREAAERAAFRLTHLHALASALADAITPAQAVADIAVRQAVEALGAAAGTVAFLRDDEQTLELVAFTGVTEERIAPLRSFPVTAAIPLADAVRSRSPILLETIEPGSRYGHLRDPPMALGDRAVAATPFLLNGRSLGALDLTFDRPRAFEEEDRIFLLALGRLCAQALERARLYEAEARARAEAEAANHAKDDFLAMVSHELRTPLTSVLGWAHILQTRLDATSPMVRGLTIIQRNAMAQIRLIEDILDITGILAGKLEIKRSDVDLAAVVQAAVDAARPSVDAAGLTLTTALDPVVGPVLGDADRLQQVVASLISNAVKFTPRGGRIDVRLDPFEAQLRIRVTDTGAGIAPDFLPYVFERFRQADSSTTRAHGGLGLGLWIAKQLVDLHRGQISAESAGSGHGATFTVLLPLHGG